MGWGSVDSGSRDDVGRRGGGRDMENGRGSFFVALGSPVGMEHLTAAATRLRGARRGPCRCWQREGFGKGEEEDEEDGLYSGE